MKKLLLGLLAIASFSAIANPCYILTKGLNRSESLKLNGILKVSTLSTEQNNDYDFGVLAISNWVDTGMINPFGEKVLTEQRMLELYENGNLLIKREYGSSLLTIKEVATKLRT